MLPASSRIRISVLGGLEEPPVANLRILEELQRLIARGDVTDPIRDVPEHQHGARRAPSSSLMVDALPSTGRSLPVPSEEERTVPGAATGARLSSWTNIQRVAARRPAASLLVHPVRASATGFRNVMRPSTPVITTPWATLASVTHSLSLEKRLELKGHGGP